MQINKVTDCAAAIRLNYVPLLADLLPATRNGGDGDSIVCLFVGSGGLCIPQKDTEDTCMRRIR